MTPHLRRQHGFGLIEVLIASLLLALFSLGAGRAVQAGLSAVHDATLHGRALDLAADLAEELAAAGAEERAQVLEQWPRLVQDALPHAATGLPTPMPTGTDDPGALWLSWSRASQPPRLLQVPVHLPAPPDAR